MSWNDLYFNNFTSRTENLCKLSEKWENLFLNQLVLFLSFEGPSRNSKVHKDERRWLAASPTNRKRGVFFGWQKATEWQRFEKDSSQNIK